MKTVLTLMFILGFASLPSNAQNTDELRKPGFLAFQTGFIVDGYNSMGIRTWFEYQEELKGNWQYSISYEHSRHFGHFLTDQLYDLSSDLSLLSLNAGYRLNLVKDRVFWTAGLGCGAVHLGWGDNNKFGPTINASLTLNIRLTKKIYFESAPLVILGPFNRVYYSPMNADHFDSFYAFTFFPMGIKVKL